MTQTSAIASGPITFFTSDGMLIDVPIGAIYFDGGNVGTSLALTAATAKLPDYLRYLAKRGDLVPAASPPTPASLIATAKVTGPIGNAITLEVVPINATTVDLVVTLTERYDGLTLASLRDRLGTAATPGSEPGLLRVAVFTAGPPDPAALDPVPPATAAGATTWPVTDSVKLEAVRTTDGFNPADFHVAIGNVQPAPGGATFTLSVTWSHAAHGVTRSAAAPAALIPAAELDGLKYLVTFTAPPDGYQLPRQGTFTLFGGREPVAAQAAGVTLLAND